MNKTLFTLCLMVGVVSSINLSGIFQNIKNKPFALVCSAVSSNPSIANGILTKLNEALAKGDGDQKFPLSIQYLSNTANQNKFKAGGDQCQDFFNGLLDQFKQDLPQNSKPATDVKDKFIQFLKNKIEALKAFFN
ncbi:unnamed protein product [Adineta ricciae]|uniref:Uncharacterized protein n=1 Tax=Adineta ricciae TaxID=249248 RepID=A0A813UDB6_ADIRI|nr:unnamed protein product [Adineta ricciae]CAF1145249.1 unnamed protein product [Adineta ricciae]